ncbi:Elongation factor 1-gamma [Balamuthia mandrillaris]
MSLKIYSYPQNPRVWKAQIAGKYVGVEIETPAFKIGVDNKTKEFLAKNPLGKVPVLETPEGCIFESNAIARYVARLGSSSLYGSNTFEAGLIEQWIDFSANEIELPGAAWLFPILGLVPNNEDATTKAKGDIRKALTTLNQHLNTRTFLVGERITLADIAVSMALYRLYKLVLDAGFRKAFGNVNRWYLTLVNQPQFSSVIGEVVLCEKMAKAPDAPKVEKKVEPKKQEAPKKAEKPAAEAAAPAETKKEKKANPLDSLPVSKLVLDEWKRQYSNTDTRTEALPWFWENYDPEGYSIYFCDYKYNDECTKLFMTNNLISGFVQRLDPLRKYGFGDVLIFGEEPKLAVSGCWLFRGTEIPAEMKECDDFATYNWRKADTTNEADRKLIEDYWAWNGEFKGGPELPFSDNGKIFK